MTKYRFNVDMRLRGVIEAEIGDRDPEEYADELVEMGISVRDMDVTDDETEIDDWDEVKEKQS